MNTQTLTQPSEPDPELTVVDSSSEAQPQRQHRPHNKVARLPKPLRSIINQMLDDGASYRVIVEKLQSSDNPPLPYPIYEKDISRWFGKGYQRYLAHQDHLDYLRGNREAALDIMEDDNTTSLPEATLQVIASQYFDLLGDFSPEALKPHLTQDPIKYARILSVFARLTREMLNLKKYRELSAKDRAVELPELDPARELSPREDDILRDHWDKFFHRRRKRPSTAPTTPVSDSNPGAQPLSQKS